MKKIIVVLCSLCLALPCLAGNLLQQEDELKFIKKVAKDPIQTYNGKNYLIREDYYGYLNGKNAYYGYIVNGIEDVNKSTNPEINRYYLSLIKNKLDNAIDTKNNDLDNYRRLKFNLSKIIVDDEDYKKLTNETKNLLQMFNYMIAGN